MFRTTLLLISTVLPTTNMNALVKAAFPVLFFAVLKNCATTAV